jgi:predicted permease
MAIRDRIYRGESADEARRAVHREFGNRALVSEDTRSVWTWTALEQFLQDLRMGARILWRSPGLSFTAIVLITLVVGGNTTIYSIVRSVLTNAAPGVHPDGLVSLGVSVDGRTDDPANSYLNYLDYKVQSKTLNPLLVRAAHRFTVSKGGDAYQTWGSLASTNYFETLGVRIFKGRNFSAEENRLDATDLVAVISHRLWQNQLQGADDIIGQSIFLNGYSTMVIGVAPPGFNGPQLGGFDDVWVPILSFARVLGTEKMLLDRSFRRVEMYGRLAPGATLRDARAEFDGISKRLQAAYPETLSRFGGEVTKGNMVAVIEPYSATTFTPAARMAGPFLAIFTVVTLLTVMIVAANVANLMLARAVVRQREYAVRQSIGASRGRILRVLIAEGMAISLASWAAVYMLALLVSRLIPELIGENRVTATVNFSPDWQVASYAVLLTIAANTVFTLAPAIHSWRLELLPWLKSGEAGLMQGRSKISSVLVVLQLAFSVVLLTATGLAYRSLSLINRPADLGFNKDNLLMVTVDTGDSAGTKEANSILLGRLRERLASIPGVLSASYSFDAPGAFHVMQDFRASNSDAFVSSEYQSVGPNYLNVLGVTPILGRDLEDGERNRPNRSAVISQNVADALWPGRSAIGETILLGSDRQPAEVVGVSPNGYFMGPSRGSRPLFVFLSAEQEPDDPGNAILYTRFSGELTAINRAIVAAVAEVDPRIRVGAMRTMSETLERFTEPARIATTLLSVFSIGSLVIAALGQYAAIAFNMKRRRRDFGLRIALGASSRQIMNGVLREGLALTAVGLVVGLLLSLTASRIAGGLLYGVTPADKPTYVGVFCLLAAASLIACYVPARRASRVDPSQTLRQE